MTKYKLPLAVFILLVATYAGLTLGLPVNPAALEQYGISSWQLRLLSLSVVLPYILMWVAAFYGYVKIAEYSETINGGKEGPAFKILSSALLVLALGSPLVLAIRSVINYYARVNPEFLPTSVIAGNYLTLLVVLIGFTFLYQGAKKLASTLKEAPKLPHYMAFLTGFSLMSLVYIYLVFSNPTRSLVDNDMARAIYYLPDWLLLLTIILPYLYTWFLGFAAGMYIYVYQKSVKGVLYKKSLALLSIGLSTVIVASVVTQFMTAVLNLILDMRLSGLLSVVYLLLLIMIVGYVLTAVGARRLQKIEEL